MPISIDGVVSHLRRITLQNGDCAISGVRGHEAYLSKPRDSQYVVFPTSQCLLPNPIAVPTMAELRYPGDPCPIDRGGLDDKNPRGSQLHTDQSNGCFRISVRRSLVRTNEWLR